MFSRGFVSPYYQNAYGGGGYYPSNQSPYDEQYQYALAMENRRRRAAQEERRAAQEAARQRQYEHELAAYNAEIARREHQKQELFAQREAAYHAQVERTRQLQLQKLNRAASIVTTFLQRVQATQAARAVTRGLRQLQALRNTFLADETAYATLASTPRTAKQAHLHLLQHQDLLERSLLKTDSIVTHGDAFLRTQRKAVVAEIQRALVSLDADVQASSPPPPPTNSPSHFNSAQEEDEEAAGLASFFADLVTTPEQPSTVTHTDTPPSAGTTPAATAPKEEEKEDEEAVSLHLFFEELVTPAEELEEPAPAEELEEPAPAEEVEEPALTDLHTRFLALTLDYRTALTELETALSASPAAEHSTLMTTLRRVQASLPNGQQ